MDGSMEGMVAAHLLDKNDPTLLTWKEIKESWGSCCNFMLSYGLKPYDFDDIESAVSISRSLKANDDEEEDETDMLESILSDPENRARIQDILNDPQRMQQMIATNPQLSALLEHPDLINMLTQVRRNTDISNNDYEEEDDESEDDDYEDYDEEDYDEDNEEDDDENDDDGDIPSNIRINIAEGDEPDKLVNLYPKGTKVTLDIGRKKNPVGKICSYNPGIGIFSNPEYRPSEEEIRSHFRTFDDEDDETTGEASYTIKYDGGTYDKIACIDIHRNWDLLDDSVATSVELPVITFPSKPRTLIVTGLMFEDIESCGLTAALSKRFTLKNISFDAILFDYNELLQKILSGAYTTLIIVSYGSAGSNDDVKSILKSEMRNCITSFVRTGGVFVVQGEGIVSTLLNKCFQKEWYSATYGRDVNHRNNIQGVDMTGIPPQYNVKAIALSNVEESSKLYSNGKYCTLALCKYGLGKFLFAGDVNYENSTADIITSLGQMTVQELAAIRATV